jgi:hypothetical protein
METTGVYDLKECWKRRSMISRKQTEEKLTDGFRRFISCSGTVLWMTRWTQWRRAWSGYGGASHWGRRWGSWSSCASCHGSSGRLDAHGDGLPEFKGLKTISLSLGNRCNYLTKAQIVKTLFQMKNAHEIPPLQHSDQSLCTIPYAFW